jgi:hypothetical protein
LSIVIFRTRSRPVPIEQGDEGTIENLTDGLLAWGKARNDNAALGYLVFSPLVPRVKLTVLMKVGIVLGYLVFSTLIPSVKFTVLMKVDVVISMMPGELELL